MFEGDRRTSRSFSGDALKTKGDGVKIGSNLKGADSQEGVLRTDRRRRRTMYSRCPRARAQLHGEHGAKTRRSTGGWAQGVAAAMLTGGRLGGKRGVGHGDEVGVVGGTWKRSEASRTV